jgi:hypothetical protein
MLPFLEEGAAERLRSHSAPRIITPTPPPTAPSACRALLCIHPAHTPRTCVHSAFMAFSVAAVGGKVHGGVPPTTHKFRRQRIEWTVYVPSAMNQLPAGAPSAPRSAPVQLSPVAL